MSRPLSSPDREREDLAEPPAPEPSPRPGGPVGSRWAGLSWWGRRAAAGLFFGYTAGLCAVWIAFQAVGESWWLTTALLYLPRVGFALPLPLVILALGLFGPHRLLPALLVPVGIWLFPLMGLHLGLGAASTSRAPSFSVLTYNVAMGHDRDGVVAVITEARPDVVVLQEFHRRLSEDLARALPDHHRHVRGQFALWSRFPIEEVFVPPPLEIPGSPPRSARYLRYRLATPLGPVDLFNMHPVSPRNGLAGARGDGFFVDFLRVPEERALGLAALEGNTLVRRHQVEAIVRDARSSPVPVVVAGDTNLPGQSRLVEPLTDSFRDAFAVAGRGFGYTFPARRPWMRIDRVLVQEPLEVAAVEVRGDTASDHRAVRAVLVGQLQDDGPKSKK